jgi:hypothetical protein
MSITIKEIDNEYWLFNVSHTPVNLTPFTDPNAIRDFLMLMRVGRIKNLCGLELNKEYYYLDYNEDFEISERIEQIKHEDGIYDELFYSLNAYAIKKIYFNNYDELLLNEKI